ncbi:MAG: glycosyltransferase family 4 protein [Pseudomonadales bacterium]|nr:glycosyltransferase family 4 protein [Pseudomonadales bacterium]
MKNTINIAIDGREANILNRVGSNVYAFEIITALAVLLENQDNIKVTVLLAKDKVSDMPKERKNWSYVVFGPQKFWTQWALPLHLFQRQKDYDILFTPGHYAPRISVIPYVSTVMDTAYLEFPEQFKESDTFKLTNWTQYSVKNAKKVIAISKYTKQQVIENYKKSSNDVVIAYPAVVAKNHNISDKKIKNFFKKHGISEPYLLFVGTFQPRKNLVNLIEAFEIFDRMKAGRALKKRGQTQDPSAHNKVKLVLAGKIGWLSDEIMLKINTSSLKNRIIITGFVSEEEKQMLYKKAFASCLVGLHEGFGIPPLESLNFLVPPIVSKTTSLPEVVGKAGFLVNPLDSKDIANKIWEVFSLTSRNKGLFRKAARRQIKKFNWAKSAEIILDTLLEVIDQTTKNNTK